MKNKNKNKIKKEDDFGMEMNDPNTSISGVDGEVPVTC